MLSIELFLSDISPSKQTMDDIAFRIQGFFIDTFPDIESTKHILIIFSDGYFTRGYYESGAEKNGKKKSFQKRIFVRVGGRLISKYIVRGEREPSFPWSLKRDAFEVCVKEILLKKEKQEVYFDYQ